MKTAAIVLGCWLLISPLLGIAIGKLIKRRNGGGR